MAGTNLSEFVVEPFAATNAWAMFGARRGKHRCHTAFLVADYLLRGLP
jgi:hypothetical protein